MSEHKDGVYCRVGVDDGQVMLLFSKDPEGGKPANISTWHIAPKQCVAISEAMARAAWEADTNLKPVGDALKAQLVEQHRTVLMNRLTIMLNTMRDDRTHNNWKLATQILDAVFAEIF